MKPLFKLVTIISGYGSVSNPYTLLSVLGILSKRNMLVAERFIRSLVEKYGRHTVYTDGGTWYPQACHFFHLKHMLHSPLEKSLIERMMQYFKDRTECFDDYYPCWQKGECNLFHVHNLIQFFVSMYNDTIANKNEFVIQLQTEVINLS